MSLLKHGGIGDYLARLHGLNKADLLDFSANINPLGISPVAKKAIQESFDEIIDYPDITYYDLKSSIATYEQIDENQILLGNGGIEVIFNIARVLKPRKALLFAPTFSGYEEALETQNTEITYYKLSPDNNFDYDTGILDAITAELDIMFLCSPNNPSGNIVKPELLEEILDKATENKVILVIDESFIDFVKERESVSAKRYYEKYDNLIIVKSATKFFAIPGLRIGYAYTKSPKIVDLYNKIIVPWCVNSLASVAFIATSNDDEYIKKSKDYIGERKEKLYNDIKDILGVQPVPPTVNFILFKIDKKMDLQAEMLKRNILIRSCANYVNLGSDYYRVAVRADRENEILVKALKDCLKEC